MTKTPVVLGTRALNRATLARQLLLKRVRMTAGEAVEHLVGLQAQAVKAPYYQLWSRLADFDPEELSGLLGSREVVRIVAMRSTIHLVGAGDALVLRPLSRPAIERELRMFVARLGGVDLERPVALTRELVEERPRATKEIRERLTLERPDKDPASLSGAARCALPMVQVTPRAMWRRSGRVALTTVESRLGRVPEADPDPEPVLLRYLAAFGPASVRDMQTWSGLTGLGEVVDRLAPTLRTFRDPKGRVLYDIENGHLPDPDTPAPARFVPEFDNLFLSHADRSRIVPDACRGRTWQGNQAFPVLFVDGFLAGIWGLRETKETATPTVEPFAGLTRAQEDEVETEGARMLAAMTSARKHELVFRRR
ncbi:winged helix DNA-binding domain-containing protein [Streptomyces sp. GC420]|uniref:winged helix DNA-binding domain-containing protein n=1 Tax=Streptomyces sp. GC420 TaxID=2697568 RepID=UPI0014151E1B|nr:winged helix DNA-binding domain-containing protein [Streptomyces sp. GC420]NBM18611.1 winged helix DNA-binding domain-containing protein [Streptomyces sp. GC420]